MEWVDIKIKQPDPQNEAGYYVVLVGSKPHVCYFGQRNWASPWHLPDEWMEPTHYIRLDSVKDLWSNVKNQATMD